jgi:hypothetical protein
MDYEGNISRLIEVISQNLPGGIGEDHGKFKSG